MKIQSNRSQIIASFLVLGLSTLLSACLSNNFATSTTSPQQTFTTNGGNTAQIAAFALTTVTPDSVNPAGALDLIGDGSSAIGKNCIPTTANTSPTAGPSTCTCNITYIQSGFAQSIDVPTYYQDQNQLRCLYNGVPAGIYSFTVKAHVTTSDTYSSAITFSTQAGGGTLDPTLASTFVPVGRYQCKDVLYIPHLLDGNIYDPNQSEDPNLTFPFLFYTTNFGAAIQSYVTSGQTYWDCPQNPHDSTNAIPIYSKDDGSLMGPLVGRPNLNGTFTSLATLGVAEDRSSFVLAQKPAGIFTIPFNTYVAPTVVSSSGGTTPTNPAPTGYGAAPLPLASGESCNFPASLQPIPAGFHWVKVWLFRADMLPRHYLTSAKLISSGGVLCNMKWATGGAGVVNKSIFCNTEAAQTGLGGTVADPTPVWRAIPNAINSTTASCYSLAPAAPDTWAFSASATAQKATDWLSTGAGGQPQDPNPSSVVIPGDTTRFDFIFTVSSADPANPNYVNASDMENTGIPSSRVLHYSPFRFKNASDCDASPASGYTAYAPPQPLSAPVGKCMNGKAANAITNYGLKLHDLGTNGDPPAGNSNRSGVFPMCALQAD